MSRMIAARTLQPIPAIVKKNRAQLAHFSPPVKGLAQQAKSTVTDPQFASTLTNFYVDDDRITCRAGYTKTAAMTGAVSVEHLIPFFGEPEKLLAATNNTFCNALDGSLVQGGFTSNDWYWTAFSNFAQNPFTVMCNGS